MSAVDAPAVDAPEVPVDPLDSEIELVFGITRPVGTPSTVAVEQLQNSLTNYGYQVHVIKLSDLLEQRMLVEERWTDPKHAAERYTILIEEGNKWCREAQSQSELARRAIIEIQRLRELECAKGETGQAPVLRLAFIIDSLKRPREVTALRQVYDDHFILLGLQASESVRRGELVSKLLTEGVSDPTARALADEVIKRDGHENPEPEDEPFETIDAGTPPDTLTTVLTATLDPQLESSEGEAELLSLPEGAGGGTDSGDEVSTGSSPDPALESGVPNGSLTKENFGQDTVGTLPMSDVFVNVEKRVETKRLIDRAVQLLFADPQGDAPTSHEYGMQLATTASTTSPELGRRVGAAIFGSHGDLLAVGSNHHPLDPATPAYDAGALDVRATARATLEAVSSKLNETERAQFEANPDQYVRSLFSGAWKDSDLKAITEYQRAVHAEMNALMSATRQRVDTSGATIYVTSYPCHNCAKHLLALGFQAVYLEPYAKGRAASMYGDATNAFVPFTGVAPRRFHAWFNDARTDDRKDKSGMLIHWDPGTKRAAMPAVNRLISQSTVLLRELFTIDPTSQV